MEHWELPPKLRAEPDRSYRPLHRAPTILCPKPWARLTLTWQSYLLLLLQLGCEHRRLAGLALAFLVIWGHLFRHTDSV